MPTVMNRLAHGRTKYGRKPGPKKQYKRVRTDDQREYERTRETIRGRSWVRQGIPQIPEHLRALMEAGYEPTQDEINEMKPFILAACERFQDMHLQEMRESPRGSGPQNWSDDRDDE